MRFLASPNQFTNEHAAGRTRNTPAFAGTSPPPPTSCTSVAVIALIDHCVDHIDGTRARPNVAIRVCAHKVLLANRPGAAANRRVRRHVSNRNVNPVVTECSCSVRIVCVRVCVCAEWELMTEHTMAGT